MEWIWWLSLLLMEFISHFHMPGKPEFSVLFSWNKIILPLRYKLQYSLWIFQLLWVHTAEHHYEKCEPEWCPVGNVHCKPLQCSCSTAPLPVEGVGECTLCTLRLVPDLTALCCSPGSMKMWCAREACCCSPGWSGVCQATEAGWGCWLWV